MSRGFVPSPYFRAGRKNFLTALDIFPRLFYDKKVNFKKEREENGCSFFRGLLFLF